MVGKEFNDREIDGLFAATPPLEGLRMLLSWAATVDRSPRSGRPAARKSIMIADVSRAFFVAPARRDVCVELPAEALAAGETCMDTVGKLEASLYGTRDASANWQDEVNKCMRQWGFVQGKYNPCTYWHPTRAIRCLVHGDDFVSVGASQSLAWMEANLKERFEVKVVKVGQAKERGEVPEARILNRAIRVTPDGWEYEADQRHVDLVKEIGVDKMSTLTPPGGDKEVMRKEEETEALVGGEATRF